MAKEQGPWWMGAVLVVVGFAIILVALDVVPNDPAALHAPRWVLGLCGLVVLLAGIMVWTNLFGESRMTNGLAVVLLVSMASIGSWVAFGPGERNFNSTTQIGPFSMSGGGEGSGRVFFGIGAVLTWLVALWAFRVFLRGAGGQKES